MENTSQDKKLINISKRTFIGALIMLSSLVILAIVLTYVLPKGAFATNLKGEINYNGYYELEDQKGINIFKGIFAPILILTSSDGLSVIMLSLFLIVIAGAFQVMLDNKGIAVIVNRIIERFKHKKFLLLAIISLIFMLFGAILGLFEEMLTLLPIIAILCVSLGFDSFTGFLVSIVSVGFGFSSALTNPFTVIFASNIIGANPMGNILLRILIFALMYGLMLSFIYLYTKKIQKDPEKSYTLEHDKALDLNQKQEEVENEQKIFATYVVFFVLVLSITILFSSISPIRDYIIPALILVFLAGGLICGYLCFNKSWKMTFKSFLKGILSALPTIAFILLASSVKYILVEGNILPTISHSINNLVQTENKYLIGLILLGVILVLEFFISSSTAKAIFVMSILGFLNLGITKETLVLIYTLGDGYTNLLFPTSPVLLIGLSMVGMSYFKWLKKSWLLFVITFILVIGFIMLAILLG